MTSTRAAESDGAAADVASPTTKDDHHHRPPPSSLPPLQQDFIVDEASLLRSHIVPPSHILAHGKFIHLPPPSSLERSTFFERSVAEHGLIDLGDDRKSTRKRIENEKKKEKRQVYENETDDGGDSVSSETTRNAKRKKKSSLKTSTASYVHPLAIVSARLRSKGVEELNKAINLSGLAIGGEYVGVTHVVDQQQRLITDGKDIPTSNSGGGDKGKKGVCIGVMEPSSTENGKISDSVDETILQEDLRLRSEYVLQRRRSQYDNASNLLLRHSKRLSLSVGVSRILDNRLQTLRHKWHLVAPEHVKRNVGPIRPREVMAVDVGIYDRDTGGGRRGGSGIVSSYSSLGRIATRVPRFATMELDEEYNVLKEIKALRTKVSDVIRGLKEEKDGGEGEDCDISVALEDMQKDQSRRAQICKTKAEPFAIADPALGKLDPDFDPDKVPLLTLSFEIEKPSTGFIERATLSSSVVSSSSNDRLSGNESGIQQPVLHPDERVIEALQHSLFCASLFESIRTEIIPSSIAPMGGAEMSLSYPIRKTSAWLSSEMEESYLPPPSVMAGGEDTNQIENTRLLCVVHCHEGEVKVQLDNEYSFTAKLIEVGTTVAAGKQHNDSNAATDIDMNPCNTTSCSGMRASGSQSPDQLRTLCRSMLLHSQSLYHDHCMMINRRNASNVQMKEENHAVGFARIPKESKLPSPHILKSCVGLGCKFIFERKVRSVLKVRYTS